MNRLRKFARLSAHDRRLLIRTVILMSGLRLGLWFLPFRRLVALGGRKGFRPHQAFFSPERMAWAVQVVSRYLPHATCLVQALTAKALLKNAGFPADMHIGVDKANARFQAHAWVEVQGQVVIGGDPTPYTRLPAWEAKGL